MYSLPYVNITIKNTGPGTASDLRGSFELKAGEKDTIVFSRVGYQTRMLPADAVNRLVLIFMKEETRMLDAVEIKDHRPAWLPIPPPVSPWQNPTFNRPFTETPGFQGIQTFGPGHVFKMPGSGFKKEARAKQRLRQLEEENDKARDYIHMVNGPEIKGKLMEVRANAGLSFGLGELRPGVGTMACAVRGPSGEAIGALVIAGLGFDKDLRPDSRLAQHLKRAADNVSAQLAG